MGDEIAFSNRVSRELNIKMFPYLSALYISYFRFTNSVLYRYSSLWSFVFYDFNNLFFCKLRTRPTLFAHIKKIVFLRTYKKMGRVDAYRVVAFVKDVQPIRYFTIFKFPCHPMRLFHPVIDYKIPIALARYSTTKKPTTACFFNFIVKTFEDYFFGVGRSHFSPRLCVLLNFTTDYHIMSRNGSSGRATAWR